MNSFFRNPRPQISHLHWPRDSQVPRHGAGRRFPCFEISLKITLDVPDPSTTERSGLAAKAAELSGAHAVLTWRLCALGGHHKGFRFDARSQPGRPPRICTDYQF